jgi:putative phage-type endonuclease
MAITEQQRQERRKYLGSSDIAALFVDEQGASLDPFKTATDVWASKVFELEPDKTSKAQDRGNRYESALIEFASQELGVEIETNPEKLGFISFGEGKEIFACNLDGFTKTKPHEIIEAKTTGLTGEWGEPGTDDVPLRVNLQVQHQMLCTGFQKAHIAVLLGKWGLTEEMYLVERNEEIINAIIARGTQFWNDFVLTKTPPPATEAGHIETFKRIVRVPEKFAEVDSGKVFQWELRRQVRLDAEKKEKESFAELLTHLGDAEGVHLEDGRLFTYFSQKGADVIDRKKLQSEYPDVYQAVTRENSYRVARIKKG